MKKETIKYLLDEEAHAFKGWDFSYLKGRWINEELPWNYNDFVKKYLKASDNILDMGTGGGELLLSFNHPYDKTSVTEAYEPNIKLCLEKLAPMGISVYPIKQDDILINVKDNYYDIVLNHHESFLESEVKRVLKEGSLFITQQVGAYNNNDLATFFDENHQIQFPKMTLDKTVERLEHEGFEIIYKNECFPKIKFLDLGAIAYFAKIIQWEFINFSVKGNIEKFEVLEKMLNEKGYIESTEHRFMIVARKKDNKEFLKH